MDYPKGPRCTIYEIPRLSRDDATHRIASLTLFTRFTRNDIEKSLNIFLSKT